MFQYRVTKYNPDVRGSKGAYPVDEWTSVSDIGRSRGGTVLTRGEYERVENAYVATALAFLHEAGVAVLTATGLENAKNALFDFEEGSVFSPERAGEVIRRLLREEFWCRLEGPLAFVHVGYDYYMYLGVPKECPEAVHLAQRLGLFVEPFCSPYLDSG